MMTEYSPKAMWGLRKLGVGKFFLNAHIILCKSQCRRSPSLHFNEILDCFEASLKLKQAFAKLELSVEIHLIN